MTATPKEFSLCGSESELRERLKRQTLPNQNGSYSPFALLANDALSILDGKDAEIEQLKSERSDLFAKIATEQDKSDSYCDEYAALKARAVAALREISAEAGVTTSDMAAEIRSKQRIIDLVNTALAPAGKGEGTQ